MYSDLSRRASRPPAARGVPVNRAAAHASQPRPAVVQAVRTHSLASFAAHPSERVHDASPFPIQRVAYDQWTWQVQNPTDEQVANALADVVENMETAKGWNGGDNTVMHTLTAQITSLDAPAPAAAAAGAAAAPPAAVVANGPFAAHVTMNRADLSSTVKSYIKAGSSLVATRKAMKSKPYHVTVEEHGGNHADNPRYYPPNWSNKLLNRTPQNANTVIGEANTTVQDLGT